jgi:glycosyltransferase involved in cell wall biosynthesis
MERQTRLAYVATDPVTAFRLLDGQLAFMRERGFDVTMITAPGSLLDRVGAREGVRTIGVPMERNIAPRADAVALGRLTALFRRLRPDIVIAGTPKGGLLGVTAARFARVPVVIYHLRGLRYATATGLKRRVLMGTEHIAAGCADWVFCNGESLRGELVARGFARAEKTWIPAAGTSNGVDVERFAPTDEARAWAKAERARLGIRDATIVVGFVGRFTHDKGLHDLAAALRRLPPELDVHLLAVGDFDATDPVPADVVAWMRSSPRVTMTGFVDEPARYFAMMDVFAFPSYREGFPNAPLEAASASLPAVAFRAIGTVDAIVDGETGRLVEIGDVSGFANGLLAYATDAELRRAHGANALRRVSSSFRREQVWAALADKFRSLAP